MTINVKNLNLKAARKIETILRRLKIRVRTTPQGLAGTCPMPHHVGDANNDNAFTISSDGERWACWSHQCHEQYGRDLISLVRTYKQCGFKDACEAIAALIDDKSAVVETDEPINNVDRMLRSRGDQHALTIPEHMLEQLSPRVTYMESRGFSKEILREHEIGYYEGRTSSSFMRNRIIFPIRNIEGQLVGFTGRSVIHTPEELKSRGVRKWLNSSALHLSAFLPKAQLLYNSHQAKHTTRGGAVILVEGPIDVLRLSMAGIKNACAVLGADFSIEQEKMVRQMGSRIIVPLFDNDDAGNNTRKKIVERFGNRDIIQVEEVDLPVGKDPGDLTIEEAKEILNDYRS